MISNLYMRILKKSPWDNFQEDNSDNIFTKKRKDQFNLGDFNFNFNLNGKVILIILALLVTIWMSSGIYKIEEGQQAIVMRFGKFHRISLPGLNYHLPIPIETKIIEKVDQSRRVEVGYRSTGQTMVGGVVSARDVKKESLMLTGDENIIELHVDAMWHIKDLANYIFNIDNQLETVKAAAESAIREVIGNTKITSVLSNKKQDVAVKIEELMQRILDQYESGVEIEQVKLLKAEPPKEVIDAYRDLQTAKADKEKVINESEAYMNDVLPKARGESARILQKAEGYQAEVIAKAKGNVSRFNAVYKEYMQNKDVTKNRLYLEAMEDILTDSNKVIMGGDGMLPHMSVNQKNILEK
jgi:modulator of FtsH protease HflK